MGQLSIRACTAALSIFVAAEAPAQVNGPPQGLNDPHLWLEEVYGGRPMDWANKENEKTLTRMLSEPLFDVNYRLALQELRASEGSSSHYQIYRGKIYNDVYEGRRRLLKRAELQAFLDGKPEWTTVFDDSVQPVEDGKLRRHLPSQLDLTCWAARCMFLYAVKGERSKDWASELREYDLDRGRFVDAGFVVASDTEAYAGWQDRDTLLLAKDWGSPGDLKGSAPTTLKTWRRGEPVPEAADKAFHRGSNGVLVQAVRNDRDQAILILTSGDMAAQPFAKVGKHPPRKTVLPAQSSIQVYSGNQIVFSIAEQWRFDGQTHPAGALLSLNADELTAPRAKIHVVKNPGPRQGYLRAHGTKLGLLVEYLDNVRGRLSRFAWHGDRWHETAIAVPENVAVTVAATAPTATTALVSIDRFDRPAELHALDMKTGTLSALGTARRNADPSDILIEQREAASADGVRVPYFVVRRRGVPVNGDRPALLYGYGALGAPRLPSYDGALNGLWIARGGVYVLANIRGGGEFAGWHMKGMERRHVYEDFIAVAQDIIACGLTSPKHLGIQGHSNGGLLVGATLNLRPELFAAAVMLNPVLDLWAHVGGVDSDEYGAWSKADERAYLLAESPYHALRPHKSFPVPLVMTSTNDNVFPKSTRKYVAKLRSFGQDVFYYEQPEGEHECGPTIEQCALKSAIVFTYLGSRLGLEAKTEGSSF